MECLDELTPTVKNIPPKITTVYISKNQSISLIYDALMLHSVIEST